MADKTKIKTTKVVYPQIYAYTLPQIVEDRGWIKIGYTEREDVDTRIREQTHTAAIRLTANKLWSEPAKYSIGDGWFNDKKLHKYLTFQKNIKQRLNTEWFYYDGTPERAHEDFEDFCNRKYDQSKGTSEYTLRDEQEAAVKKTVAYARDHIGGKFLWNAKPRFGKTLTTYDLARKLNAETVLVVTNRPAIANSWFDDFEKFIAWQTDYAFVSTTDSLKERPIMSREEFMNQLDGGKQRMVAFISLQDIKGAIPFGGDVDKLKWVKDLHWDLLVVDESHEGADTLKADVAFDNINRDFMLNLSGTPFKAVAKGTFSDEQIFNWTYADEQTAKKNWSEDDEEHNPYRKLPCLNLFSYQMSRMITDEVDAGAQINGKDEDYAFDLNEFFLTNVSGKFIHEDDVRKWLHSLWENDGYPFSNTELRNELKHTFWILNRVASAKALEKLIKNMDVFDGYEVVIAAGDGRTNDDQVQNMRSLDKVRKTIAEHNRTITLSVGQLTTGVTVPQWTGVLMLSNIKSPSLYMQAAFRSQNPWTYTENGIRKEKANAYVFDFSPERTLMIYDDFANDLSGETTNGGGTTEKRKDNLKKLLNFFPVIAEDTEGKMVELDVNQVLTIPKSIKAKEVVKRGFMSNLLFQNIGGIFASTEAREILEQMPAVSEGKTVPNQKAEPVDTKKVQVDDKGEAVVEPEAVEPAVEYHFGEKIYAEIESAAENVDVDESSRIAKNIADTFHAQTLDSMKSLAKDSGLTTKVAETATEQGAKVIAREVERVQRQAKIKVNEAQVEYQTKVQDAQHDTAMEEAAKRQFAEAAKRELEQKRQQIQDDLHKNMVTTIVDRSKEVIQSSTATLLRKAEDKKKNTVEDDIRSRLRGFARTIPSFLMAYGTIDTTLANFDTTISEKVFQEVTGITLTQFRKLRDDFQFFDPIVFNESCLEFLRKRVELENYFNDTHDGDIFDYIPSQKTNQIFTPKKVVKMMIDKLEEETPGIFEQPDKTFADLYIKSGLYLTEIVKRLYDGLAEQIPDGHERIKHILEHQIYGFAPSEIIYNIARNFIFGFDASANDIDDSHVVCLDTTTYAMGNGDFEAKCDELFGKEIN
ncbi:DEAD/DEAH box helicase family protein [Lactiplantibacillus sp. WILCCON 0030]|uniref:DEAD/DEAH box helicase family protein n=1 Tax=Lactiplantibacillus brownii TaxID=3069269 RepID=A0ABU1A8T1_9LACO|nr:DEAD/DEAH box helicase family protein [Lactiplantibacillus brownii]MDQ7936755.1 DEAD/DEAH box helicase family protein [Lactiplantibacillus brownii]